MLRNHEQTANAKRRGVTLLEMSIVLAILAIISTVVVSFCIICNRWVKVGTERGHLMDDEYLAEQTLRNFVSVYDSDTSYFVDWTGIPGGGIAAMEMPEDPEGEATVLAKMCYSDGYLLIYRGDAEKPDYYPIDNIDRVVFRIWTSDSGKQLLSMQLDWTLDMALTNATKTTSGTHTVSVSSRTGKIRPLSGSLVLNEEADAS